MSAGVRSPERLTGVWTVLPGSARAAFRVRDKLVGHASGTIPVRSGTVRLGPGGGVESARLELDAAAIDTGNAHRDRDLRTPRFLATGDHPLIVVEAGPAPLRGPGWVVPATLTARGAAAPVELTVTLDAADEAGVASEPAVTVRVTGRLDRSPLGLRAPAVLIGRIVELDARLTLRR